MAACAVLIFHLVSITSGRLEALDGLGWDGFIYSGMVSGDLADGSPNARMRPLIVLLTRIPYSLGVGMRASFELLNSVYAFVLYLGASLLLELYRASLPARAIVVMNLALCMATSKMFAFYPAQVDLGALAFVTMAFYLAASDRHAPAGVACVLAAASREFGIAASLYGLHRTIRQRRPWRDIAAYLPGIATLILIRWWSSSRVGGGDPFSPSVAVQNLTLWASPAFAAAFAYFAVTVFGGLSAVLMVRPRWCGSRLLEEPELATFLIVVVGLTIGGNLDIWRYLVFSLPVALVLVARFCREQEGERLRNVIAVMTFCTVLTQRPFEQLDAGRYFRDWFPLYHVFGVHPSPPDLGAVWATRGVSLLLLLTAVYLATREKRTEVSLASAAGAPLV